VVVGEDGAAVPAGAVTAGHRFHDDVEERHGLLAALVEAAEHGGVPRATAGGPDVAAQFEIAWSR
jgi:hypothetical protein